MGARAPVCQHISEVHAEASQSEAGFLARLGVRLLKLELVFFDFVLEGSFLHFQLSANYPTGRAPL